MVIPLIEVFHSIQGEGTNAGQSAIFIRFAGCNLDCVFADGSVCDTPWRKPRMKLSLDDLEGVVRDFECGWKKQKHRNPWIILTGGEPTAAPAFNQVVERFHRSHRIAVETNGTRWRDTLRMVEHVCVSPKNIAGITHAKPTADSTTPDSMVVAIARELRFVVTGRHMTLPRIPPATRDDVDLFVSPAVIADGMGMEIAQYLESGTVPMFVEGAAERCLEIIRENARWKLSVQMHKWLMLR